MMKSFHVRNGERQLCASLWDALGLDATLHKVISFVGAGGKTSLMFAMAEEAAEKGCRVIVTTSTKIFVPEHCQVVISEFAEDIGRTSWNGNILVVGRQFSDEKLKSLSIDELEKLTEYADILLIEADGARRLPLKFPGAEEPVLIPKTQAVVSCVGLDCIGQRFMDGCFRYEMAESVLGKKPEDRIALEDVADVLCRPDCAGKDVNDRIYCPVLNKCDLISDEMSERAALLVEKKHGVPCTLVSFCMERK